MPTEEDEILYCGKYTYRSKEVIQWIRSGNDDHVSKLNFIIEEALKTESFSTVKFLLSNGYKVVPLNKLKQTALHLSVFYDSPDDIISALFKNCDTSKNHADKDGLTYFHIACIAGNVSVAEGFIKQDVDINLKCHSSGFTALHFAVTHGRTKIVELLLKNRVDVEATDSEGRNALHVACGNSKRYCELIANVFIKNRDKGAVENENTESQIVELLVKGSSDVNKQDQQGNTPVFKIFQNDQYEKLRSIRRLKNYIYYDKRYRLIVNELRKKQKKKLEILLQNSVDLKVCNKNGETVLHWMIERLKPLRWPKDFSDMCFDDSVNSEMLELLLKQGTLDANAKNNENKTPLQQAISVMSLDIVKVLLRYISMFESLKFDFHYPNIYPCLEVVENVIEIVTELTKKGFCLSLQADLPILKFFTYNHQDCDYEDNADINRHHKLMNLLQIGTTLGIRKVFSEMWRRKVINKVYLGLGVYLKQLEYANIWVDKENMTLIKAITQDCKIRPQWVEDCQEEVLLMKKTMLGEQVSLHDVMEMNPDEIYEHLKNGNYKQILRSPDFGKFNCYEDIIKGHFAKGLMRQYLLESTCDYLRLAVAFGFPDLCCENILNHLSNEDMCNFCFATVVPADSDEENDKLTSLYVKYYMEQLRKKQASRRKEAL
ncbi:putative ankyrin repeat protein RF_0381 [Nasonia vitripennis]|uniref:Uncharacterized protein n=1 Tax=Nasonia vitripennis TaxID=7425 RepID=A0A7M7Q0L1_NASVI|nr:putative ankyrin repeat protein RF_0381 [Nasonia vitripennis]